MRTNESIAKEVGRRITVLEGNKRFNTEIRIMGSVFLVLTTAWLLIGYNFAGRQMTMIPSADTEGLYGSILLGSPAIGAYALVGILAFTAGVIVALMIHKITNKHRGGA